MSSSDLKKMIKVLNNFGMSDDGLKKCLFTPDAYVVSSPTCAKNLEWHLLYREFPNNTVFGTKVNHITIWKTVLIGDWFSTKPQDEGAILIFKLSTFFPKQISSNSKIIVLYQRMVIKLKLHHKRSVNFNSVDQDSTELMRLESDCYTGRSISFRDFSQISFKKLLKISGNFQKYKDILKTVLNRGIHPT